MKNALVIKNIIGTPLIIPVEDFSDENVKEAISSSLKVDKENLECLVTGQPMIYGVKELYPKLKSYIGSVQPWYAESPAKHFHYLHVIVATTENKIS